MVKVWKYFKRLNCSSSCNTCCCAYDTLRDEQSQIVKLPNGDSITIYGYKRSYLHSFSLVIMSLFTCFIGLIVASLQTKGLIPWFYRRSAISNASKILLPPNTLVKVQNDSDGRKWFIWRHHRFTWCSQSGKFKRVRCVDEIGLRFSDIHGLGNGLDASNHQLRKNNYGKNTTDVPSPNLLYLLFLEFWKPFRLYQIAATAVWILQSYYVYAGLIAFASLVEIALRVTFQYQYQRRLHRLCSCSCEVTVLSPGHERRRMMSDELVPGCVIEISRQSNFMTMPCDAVVLAGSCVTRETERIKKIYQLPKSRTEIYNPRIHRQHTLLRGSSIFLESEKVIALVIRTGWNTENGTRLAAQLDNSNRPSSFDCHTGRLFLCLGFLGLCAAVYGVCRKHPSLDILSLLLEGMSFIVVSLPPLCSPALFFTGLYGFLQLYQIGIRFNSFDEPGSVLNLAGATDTVCLLENVVLKNADTSVLKVSSNGYDEWSRDPKLTLCMTVCADQNVLNDLKMFSTSTWRVISEEQRLTVQSTENDHETYQLTKIYVDETNYSSPFILVRADPVNSVNAVAWYFLRGSYSRIVEFTEELSFSERENGQVELVAFAGRPLTESEKASTLEPDLNLLTRKFHLFGVASIGVKISEETCKTISELRTSNTHVLMISRQGLEEAVHLARSTGIIYNKEPVAKIEIPSTEALHPPSLSVVDLPETGTGTVGERSNTRHHPHVVLTGSMLDALLQSFPEMVDQIIGQVTVFASASPLQTNRFLERLHGLDRRILVCKDGDDDCSTVPVTYLTLTPHDERQGLHQDLSSNRSINSIGKILIQSRASLAKCLGILKVMVCYSVARLTSTILLYNNPSPAIQLLYIDLALIMGPTLLFGNTQTASQPLSKKIPSRSIAHPKEILSLIAQLILVISSQYVALIMARHQPWFESSQVSSNMSEGLVISDENYALYSLSLFQHLSFFVIFSSGPPHLRRIWTNLGLLLYLLTFTVFSCVVVLIPPAQLEIFMGLKLPPIFDFRLALLSVAIIYVFTSFGVQYLIDYCSIKSCACRCLSRPSRETRAPLDNVNVNVLYRPYTLTTQQPASDLSQPTALNLPIF